MASSLLAKGFLTFSHGIIIAPLLMTGFFTQGGFFVKSPSSEEARIWGYACLLVLFSMIFNVFLKSLFQAPLDPLLGIKGFAFPSGHMQVSLTFYGWLFVTYSHSTLRLMLLVILAGIGYGLVQQGYHTLTDVAGAGVFGAATLYAFSKATSLPHLQKNPARLGLYLITLAGLMMGIVHMRTGIPPHLIKTFIALVGFSLFWLWQMHRGNPKVKNEKSEPRGD